MKGTIRQKDKARWEIVYDLPPGPDGKRKQRSVTVHGPKKQAQIRLREILASLDSGIYAEPSKITVADALDDWLEALQVTDKTRQRYEEIVRLHLRPGLGHLKLQKLTPDHVEAFYREKRSGGRADGRAGGLSERTLLHCHRVLHEAMKRAVSRKRIASNPCADVAAPKPRPSTVGVLDEKQTGKLLEAAQGTRLYVPILVAVTTGLRLGELLGLAWDDVDLKTGRLSVRRTLQRLKGQGLVLKDFPKTKSGFRAVALPPLTVEALRRHRIQQRQDKMRVRLVWQEHGLVFPNEIGEPWGPDSVSHQFGRLAGSLGFAITFHSLRHSHSTHLLRAGVHMKIASGRLGHSTIAITADLYSHLLADAQEDAAQRIDDAIRGVLN